ncbi:MAG: DUF4160 domain-containing protein, partial [Prevotellaceae bacterium]|nr:DUF4160 domain-containing protein [Prevotellaceae bacterium]
MSIAAILRNLGKKSTKCLKKSYEQFFHAGNLTEGDLPVRQMRLVQAWVEIHRDNLMADWELCRNGEEP